MADRDFLGYLVVAGALGVGALTYFYLPESSSLTPSNPASKTASARARSSDYGPVNAASTQGGVSASIASGTKLPGQTPRGRRAQENTSGRKAPASARFSPGLSPPPKAVFAGGRKNFDAVRYGSSASGNFTQGAYSASRPNLNKQYEGGGRAGESASAARGENTAEAAEGPGRRGFSGNRTGFSAKPSSSNRASSEGKTGSLRAFQKGGKAGSSAAGRPGDERLSDSGYGRFDDSTASPSKKSGAIPEVSDGRPVDGADSLVKDVMTQLATDNELEGHVRERKNAYEETGVPATRDQLKADAQAYARDRGIDPDTVDIGETVERAFNPGPVSDPKAVGEYTQNVFKNYVPPPPEEKAEIRRMLDNPPEKPFAAPAKPDGPPPKDALAAYERHCDTFKWVEENLGVAPHHVLGILKTETNLGSYTGNHNVLDVLHETAALGGKKKKSADRNIAALMRLGQQKRLGRRGPEDITGSYAGAFGIAQFMPASWEAYSRDRKGKGDDPFNYEDAIVSAANYLKIHGYDQNVKKSFHAYNHSNAYVEKVNNTAERIKPGLDGLKGPCR